MIISDGSRNQRQQGTATRKRTNEYLHVMKDKTTMNATQLLISTNQESSNIPSSIPTTTLHSDLHFDVTCFGGKDS